MSKEVVLAIDIGGSKYVVGFVTDDGEVLHKRKYKWDKAAFSHEYVINSLTSAAKEMLESHPELDPDSIGVTIPGIADPVNGIWISASFMGIYDLPIKTALEKELRKPVYIENDCNACAIAEMMFGGGKECQDFLYMTVSNSIGGALVLGGRLYAGANGTAGEIGLFPLMGSPEGLQGPLEEIASGRGLAKLFQLQTGAGQKGDLSGEEIAALAREGDKAALKAIEMEGRILGRAIACACALIDPEKVIIGGGVSLIFNLYRSSLLDEISKMGMEIKATIESTQLGYDGALIGAACLALQKP